jgi:hypothetical protein
MDGQFKGGLTPLADQQDKRELAQSCTPTVPRLDKAAVLSALDDLKILPSNWSAYGANPIDRRTIEAAKELILAVPSDIIEPPRVVPMTRGRLQLEWHRGNRSLELEFETSDNIHFLKWDSDLGIEDEDVILITDVTGINALLRWFAPECGNG